jgi:hypothetical protein
LLLARPAEAQPPITSNGYSIEFFQGPLIAPVRVLGIAGAYTAIAEGVDGANVNAASPAVREPFSFNWFDYDLDVGVSFPGSYANTDFDNHGPSPTGFDRVNNFIYFNFGFQAQLGFFGASVTGEFLRYGVTPATATQPALTLVSGRYHALAAYGIAHDQLVIGAGLRAVSMQLTQQGGITPTPTSAVLTMTGAAPEVGVIAKPDELPIRLGATARSPVTGGTFGSSSATTDASGVTREGQLILPQHITLPWEVEFGLALQVGPRPLNPAWIDPQEQESFLSDAIDEARARRAAEQRRVLERTPPNKREAKNAELMDEEEALRSIEDQHLAAERARLLAQRKARYENWPREKILLVTSVLLTGASDGAVALEGFLDQKQEAYGTRLTASPRFGIEAEPLQNLVTSRVGSYVEPSRFEGVSARQHFTFGGDVRLLPFNTFGLTPGQVWRISFAIDLAPRYIDWGIALGAWH